jgi:hypothetical protein
MAIYTKKERYQLALLHLWDALKLISIMENYGGTYMR